MLERVGLCILGLSHGEAFTCVQDRGVVVRCRRRGFGVMGLMLGGGLREVMGEGPSSEGESNAAFLCKHPRTNTPHTARRLSSGWSRRRDMRLES